MNTGCSKKSIAFGVLFFISNLIAASTASAQTVAAPKYVVGDSWTTKTTDRWTGQVDVESTQTIIGVLDEFIRVRFDNRNADVLTHQLGSVTSTVGTQRADFTFTYSSKGKQYSRVTYAWPLEVGKKWTDEYLTEVRQNDGRKIEFANSSKAEVVGWDSVTVPAGTFKAIKVVHQNSFSDTTGSDAPLVQKITYWYSPEARRHVKIDDEMTNSDGTPGKRTTLELVAFKLN